MTDTDLITVLDKIAVAIDAHSAMVSECTDTIEDSLSGVHAALVRIAEAIEAKGSPVDHTQEIRDLTAAVESLR